MKDLKIGSPSLFSLAAALAFQAMGLPTAQAGLSEDQRFIQRVIKKPVAISGAGSPCLAYQIHALAEEIEQMQKSEVEKLNADLKYAFGRLEFKTQTVMGVSGEFSYVKMNQYNDRHSPMMYGPIKDGSTVKVVGEKPKRNELKIEDVGSTRVAVILSGEIAFGPVRVTQYFWDPLNHYYEESRASFHGRVRDTVKGVAAFTEKTRGNVEVSAIPSLESLRPENGYYPQLLEWYLAISVNDLQGCSAALSWTDILNDTLKGAPTAPEQGP